VLLVCPERKHRDEVVWHCTAVAGGYVADEIKRILAEREGFEPSMGF
jgi:hypothetical protein